MSQNSTVVQDGTGAQVLNALNDAIDTINTMHAGAVAPPDAECHVNMLWADTSASPALLKVCTVVGAPSTFVTLGPLTANFGLMPLAGGAFTGPVTMTAKELEFASVAPASAATLAVTGGNLLQPTGTADIAGFAAAQAGAMRQIRFTTALQLQNSASFLLFGQNITTEPGDSALFFSLGGGNWYLHSYQRADGSLDMWGAQINEVQAANITAAATTNLAEMPGNYAIVTHISGATNISALGTCAAGARRHVTFSVTGGSVALVHNGTSLILPGSDNISVTDGASGLFMSLGGGNWRLLHWQPNSLTAIVWQTVNKNTSYTVTSADSGKFFVSSASTPNTFPLPAASVSANMILGFRNANTNSAVMSIAADGSDKIEGVSVLTGGVGTSYTLICDGTAWYRMDTGIAPSTPIPFTNGSQVFTSGVSTLTISAGVYYIRVDLWGPGGGSGRGGNGGNGVNWDGGGGSYGAGGGAGGNGGPGGSGAFATGIFAVIPGQSYTVSIGAGGLAGAPTGGNGGTSSFGALLTCTGGTGGTPGGAGGNAVTSTPGTGGTAGTPGTGGTASGSGTLLPGASGGTPAAGNSGTWVAGSYASNAGGATSSVGGGASAAGVTAGASPGTSIGATGSGGAAQGISVSGTTRESGGGGNAGEIGGSPGAGAGAGIGGAGGIGSYYAATNGAAGTGCAGASGKCIVMW